MKKIRIKHKGLVVSDNILVADNFYLRLVGLMFREKPHGDGLLLLPGTSIHTFFMRYPLDVVFIDSKNRVIKIIRKMAPWRMTWIYFKAQKTLEMPAGKLPPDLNEGDALEIDYV